MKFNVYFLASLFTVTTLKSQTPSWLWAKSSNGSGMETGVATACDNSSNVFVAGHFYSPNATFGTSTFTNADNSGFTRDAFLAKYDSNGNFQWAKHAGGNADDEVTAVTTDNFGRSIIAGYFNSPSITFGSTTLANASNDADIFITCYDALGNVVWAKRFGAAGLDLPYGLTTDGSGNIYVTGYFQGPTVFGSTTLTSVGFIDMYLVKLNSSGNVVWAKRAGGNDGDDVGVSVDVDQSGNIYVTGWYYSSFMSFTTVSVANTDNSGFTTDVFTVKYDSMGVAQWARNGGNYFADELVQSISVDDTGNTYITGYFYSPSITFGTSTMTNADNSGTTVDIFVVKYNSTGQVAWTQSAGGNNANDLPGYGTLDDFGNYYVSGGFVSPTLTFGTYTINSSGGGAMFVTKYNAAGTVQWALSADGNGTEGTSGITTDNAGFVYIAGAFFSSALTFSSQILTNSGSGCDMYIAKLDNVPTSISEGTAEQNISVFPNPANSEITFQFSDTDESRSVVIYNSAGQVVEKYFANQNTLQISTSEFAEGIYFFNCTGENTASNGKFIISH